MPEPTSPGLTHVEIIDGKPVVFDREGNPYTLRDTTPVRSESTQGESGHSQ